MTAASSTRRLSSLFARSLCLRHPTPSTSTATSSRLLSTSAFLSIPAPTGSRPIPQPRPDLSTPAEFLASISRPRRDLTSNSSALTALGEEWSSIFTVTTQDLKKAGVAVKDRRYLLWAIEKLRQGGDPKVFAYSPKKKKIVRGWGPRVQTAQRIRVRGRKRPGEK